MKSAREPDFVEVIGSREHNLAIDHLSIAPQNGHGPHHPRRSFQGDVRALHVGVTCSGY